MFERVRVLRRALVAGTVLASGLVLAGCAHQDKEHQQDALKPEGHAAREILDLTKPFFWIAVVIGIGVVGATIYIAIRFREKPGEERNPKQVHGNTTLEISWTIVPALILAVMGVFTVSTIFNLSKKPTGPNVIHINVTGKQWWWEYDYTDKATGFTTANEMHIPINTPVYLTLTGADVIHSFWIPSLAGKKDTVPGRISNLTISGDKIGEYRGQCAEYCGLSHARMGLKVFVDSRADYEKWVAQQKTTPARLTEFVNDSTGPIATFGCQTCHGFDATKKATRGPNLTHLGDRTTFAAATYDLTLENLTNWIHDAPSMKPMEQGPDPKNPLKGMPNFSNPAWGMTKAQAREIARTLVCDTSTDPARRLDFAC